MTKKKAQITPETAYKDIKKILTALPPSPGVYQFFDENEKLIYIGKAKNLKNRVKSYFQDNKKGMSPKTEVLVHRIKDIKFITVATETEALILETNLIKQYKPRYNILMKDDKSYVYVKISVTEDFPRIYLVRNMVKDKNIYFGPFMSSFAMKQVINDLNKLFMFRICKGQINILNKLNPSDNDRIYDIQNVNIPRVPCLQYHIKRCGAPCLGIVSKEEYREMINHIIAFFRGEITDYSRQMQEQMLTASSKRDFERAAAIRDKIKVLEQLTRKQQIVTTTQENFDVIGHAITNQKGHITFFQIRNGKLITTTEKHFPITEMTDEEDLIELFLMDYYTKAAEIPREIVVGVSLEFEEALENRVSDIASKRVQIHTPQKGFKHNIVELAMNNAKIASENEVAVLTGVRDTIKAVKALEEVINRKNIKTIECYDISHIQGYDKVGSMVVFSDGKPENKAYKRFKIKTIPDGASDDFACLTEVIVRRIEYIRDELKVREQLKKTTTKPKKKAKKVTKKPTTKNNSFDTIPDLIILDGGKGQLSSVVAQLEALGIEKQLHIIALAKKKEEIFMPHNPEPIELEPTHPARLLIQRIRDEAHRFAISYHRNLRTKRMVQSVLDTIPGIGTTKKKLLMTTFGSVAGIRNATDDELDEIIGKKARITLREML